MKVLARMTVFMAVIVGLFLTGCATVYTPVQKGAGIGAGAGAIVGGIWGAKAGSLSGPQGALVGAAGGGLVGALVGDQLDKKGRNELAAELEDIKKQLGAKDQQLETQGKSLSDEKAENQRLRDEINQLRQKITQLENRIKELETSRVEYEIRGSVLFKSGSALLREQGKQILDRVASELKSKYPDHEFSIEGYTDTQPIKYSGWKSNWELGVARALTVLHYLEKYGFEPAKLSATTFSMYRNVKPNDTPVNMSQNRRAVIIVVKPKAKL